MYLKGQHFLSTSQVSCIDDINCIISLADDLEILARREKSSSILKGAVLASLFFEPSTRTRLSFMTAFALLGGISLDVPVGPALSLSKGEAISDTLMVIEGYADIMVIRHPFEEFYRGFALENANIPIINGGDGTGEHPTQALLDLYTIVKACKSHECEARLEDICICFVGDLLHSRTVNSLVRLLSLYPNIKFNFVSSKELAASRSGIDFLKNKGRVLKETENLEEGLHNADVVYVTRMQMEKHKSDLSNSKRYIIKRDVYERFCIKYPIIMHPMPRDSSSNPEISDDMLGHPKMMMFKQSKNSIVVRAALFCMIFGIENEVMRSLEDVRWSKQR